MSHWCEICGRTSCGGVHEPVLDQLAVFAASLPAAPDRGVMPKPAGVCPCLECAAGRMRVVVDGPLEAQQPVHEAVLTFEQTDAALPAATPSQVERAFPTDPRGALDAGAVKVTGFVRDEDGRWPARRSR